MASTYYIALPPVTYPEAGRVRFHFEERVTGTDEVVLHDVFTTDLPPIDSVNGDGQVMTAKERVDWLKAHIVETFAHIALGKVNRKKGDDAKAAGDGAAFETAVLGGAVKWDPAAAPAVIKG